jgi:hypothetical protein
MENPDYSRRANLRAQGWSPSAEAQVWVSADGLIVKVFLPDGKELEARVRSRGEQPPMGLELAVDGS